MINNNNNDDDDDNDNNNNTKIWGKLQKCKKYPVSRAPISCLIIIGGVCINPFWGPY